MTNVTIDKNRFCVIMCGGVGSRFWPYSRMNKPKQFIDFLGTGRSLLQLTVDRLQGIVAPENIVILTNKQYASLVKEQLPQLQPRQILLEPARRNTAPCIAWSAWHIKALNPDAKIMVAPSDHIILKTEEFQRCALRAFEFIETHADLLTMGIKPNRPETGYGYIQRGEAIDEDFARVKTFTEKPNEELAREFVNSGEFVWNSGMFFWHVDTIIEAMRKHAPDIALVFDREPQVFGTEQEREYINHNYASCPNISIDFAVMEKSPNVCVESVEFGWSDLGTWVALFDNLPKDDNDNVTQTESVMLFNSTGNVIAAGSGKLVVASGLKDYIVADTDNALLIVPKADEQKIRLYVNDVKSKFGEKYL